MNYDTIKEEIKNIDITLPPPQEEPERQYYFIEVAKQILQEKERKRAESLHAV